MHRDDQLCGSNPFAHFCRRKQAGGFTLYIHPLAPATGGQANPRQLSGCGACETASGFASSARCDDSRAPHSRFMDAPLPAQPFQKPERLLTRNKMVQSDFQQPGLGCCFSRPANGRARCPFRNHRAYLLAPEASGKVISAFHAVGLRAGNLLFIAVDARVRESCVPALWRVAELRFEK